MNTSNEMLDLVNADDKVMQTLSRDEIYAKGLSYVRVVEAFIRNRQGQLWIPVRAPHKRIAPGGFDVGVGGHVEHGETYDEALAKEVSEELGWDVRNCFVLQKGKYGPKEGLNTVSMVYEIQSDEAPQLNPEDFVSAAWLNPQEIIHQVEAGHPAKSNLLPLLKLVYLPATPK